jgi:hypothetical protein
VVTALALLVLVGVLVTPADARKHHSHKPSGIKGVVLNSTCSGACMDPPPPAPAYTGGGLTVTVTRVSDGAMIATSQPTDGHFRFRVKRGLYRVTAEVAPQPASTPQSSAMPANCWEGDSQEAQVLRHRFTHVELHVGNVCIV